MSENQPNVNKSADEGSAGADKRAELSPPAADVFGAAIGNAAKRVGIDPSAHASTGHVVWAAMGGWRGVIESVVPSLIFILTFSFTRDAWLAIALSVVVAAIFTVIRLIQKTPVSAALGGLVAAIAAAALALLTGKAEDNFIPGFITNIAYGSVLLVSALVGWSLIGLAAGYLMNEGTAWRRSKRKRRVYFWLTIGWAVLFFARLAVQFPLYLQGDSAVGALATAKLVMGLPLFAPMVAVTWLAVRSLYPPKKAEQPQSSQGTEPDQH